uniref:Uncharacterized protein n=1 Tax=Lygus hesperus TaxID=30085 RepID=A0A0K8SX65_LYGHE
MKFWTFLMPAKADRYTEPPGTTVFNNDDVTADISIGEINNLVPSAKLVEADNSYEINSISPFASLNANDVEFTTPTPTASPEINIVSSGSSVDYDPKLGSPEDTSYFPTAGGVNDDSRPRYGGFHNNTRKQLNSYSPYGAELRNIITTGTPISESTTISIPSTTSLPFTTTQYTTLETTTLPPPSSILPAAQQVNNLVASHNILYGASAQFSSSSEDEFDRTFNSEEQEKLLQTSGSQSLVSSHNYANFAHNFNKQGQKLYGKDTFANYAPSAIAEDPSAIGGEYFKGDIIPYFGQEPPFETISEPSAFQTQTPNFGDKILKNRTEFNDINTQASVNSYTIDSRNILESKGSLDKNIISDRMGTFGTDGTASPTWTVSPYETTQYFSSSSAEVSPSGSSFGSPSIKPTTYHPNHPSEVTTAESVQSEATTNVPTTTVQETTTTDAVWPTTMSPENPEYHSLMQAKAKEMFGMLNETAATMLMQVMTQAENNMTLRRLVLLLVDDRTKDKTEEKTRINLINALLTHENDIEEVTTVASTPPAPKKKS